MKWKKLWEIKQGCDQSKIGKRYQKRCDKFYYCIDNELSVITCAHGKNFDEQLGKCVAKNLPGCPLREDI